MRKDIAARFAEHGTLVQPAALELILGQPDPDACAERLLDAMPADRLMLTLKDAREILGAPAPKPPTDARDPMPADTAATVRAVPAAGPGAALEKGPETGAEPPRERPTPDMSRMPPAGIRIMKDVTGNSTCVGNIQDFIGYFNDRMIRLKRMLRGRRELQGSMPITSLRGRSFDREVKTIGMVTDVRRSNKGRVIAEIEDETGAIALLLPEEAPNHRINLIRDEVVGVVGKLGPNGDIIFVQGVIRPDIPISREPRRAKDPVCAAFISDIHIGSKTFLETEWRRFVSWLNDPGGYHEDYARRIEYLVISGDVVDGIGIYPDQEGDLAIRDVYEQYQVLSEHLKNIPDGIRMIMLPGNHDAVRPAEPQPTFPQEIVKLFDSNISFVGNPCLMQLEGVEVLAYHGMSIADFISGIPNLSFNTPIEVMKEMLHRRHLAPVFGDKTPLAPEGRDWMVIDSVPDIFVTGHVHGAGLETYRGVILINSSTWQSQTDYQRMMNFQPQPAKVAVVDLQTLGSRMISLTGQE